ncbi:hypothetical protein SAMN04487786_1137 [Paenisporosarcina quisquiliarum]|nr:hypothetical protein SAMN04487786_1137 [Paenisporosarcina quisquiliarum]
MAKSFYICKYKNFVPARNEIQYQIDIESFEDPQSSSFDLIEKNDQQIGFDKFIAHHEILVNKFGRANGQPFNKYIEPLDFNFFVDSSVNLMIFSLKIDAAKDFVKTYNTYHKFEIEPLDIDLSKIISRVNSITGAWFSDMKIPNMNSAGYFGNNVNKSANFKQSNNVGLLSSIQFYFKNDDTNYEHKIAISRKSCIVLMDKFVNEEAEMRFIRQIYNTFLR